MQSTKYRYSKFPTVRALSILDLLKFENRDLRNRVIDHYRHRLQNIVGKYASRELKAAWTSTISELASYKETSKRIDQILALRSEEIGILGPTFEDLLKSAASCYLEDLKTVDRALRRLMTPSELKRLERDIEDLSKMLQ